MPPKSVQAEEHMSHLAPNKFQEFYVRLYLRSQDQLARAARRVFRVVYTKISKWETEPVSSMIAPSPGRVMTSKAKSDSSMAKRNGLKTVALGDRKGNARAEQTECGTETWVVRQRACHLNQLTRAVGSSYRKK